MNQHPTHLTAVVAFLLAVAFHSGAAPFPESGRLHIQPASGATILTWTNGLLQASDDLAGPWLDQWHEANPALISNTGTKRFFRLRTATPSTLSGTLTAGGHPLHHSEFTWTLNGNPLTLELDATGFYSILTQLPGPNRLNLRHPWYSSFDYDFTIPEGEALHGNSLKPTYLGRVFSIGEAESRFVGHAGGSSLVNTTRKYEACYDARSKGMWLLEVDVLISGDGVPFLFHDWIALKAQTGLDYGAPIADIVASNQITLLEEVLEDFDGLILDLIHNTDHDATRIVDYMETHHPSRIRRDVYLQVYKRSVYNYIRDLDTSVHLSFNLASWSAWGITNDWKSHIADIVFQTDFYVINPSSMVDEDMVLFLNSNGLTNTFVPVMHTHSPLEIERLQRLAPGQTAPMIKTADLIPNSWPPASNRPPTHPVFHFPFDEINGLQNLGDAIEVGFSPAENVAHTTDSTGSPGRAIQLQDQPPSRLDFSSASLTRLNHEVGRDSTFSIRARSDHPGTPQVIAMGLQPGASRYVYGFYLYQGNAYFILTHADNTQTWVLAGSMADRRWHHLTATIRRNIITTYQDGVVVAASRPSLPAVPRTIHSFHVGRDPAIGGRSFNGAVDDILLYPYALDQDRIWSLFHDVAGSSAPNPLADWPLNQPSEDSMWLPNASLHESMSLSLEPDSEWDHDRSGNAFGALRTFRESSSGALLPHEGVAKLNQLFRSSWTISAWVNLDHPSGTQFLLGGQNRHRGHRYHLAFVSYEGKVIAFFRPAEGEQTLVEVGSLVSGQWTHITATSDGAQLSTYFNGTKVTTLPLENVPLLADIFTDFTIGFDPLDPTRTAHGLFDEVKILPVALTPSEVRETASQTYMAAKEP